MISFRDVTFGYPGCPPIFSDLDLSLREGRTTALVGRSGSGKTTLLKLACGLLVPTRGEITVGSDRVQLGNVRGIMFHEDTLLPWLTVTSNVMFSLDHNLVTQRRVHSMLKEFGLEDARDAFPHQLSQGMRKRVEFARAIVSDSGILLLDEPFASLDSETKNYFWRLWRDSAEINSRTRMVITHDLDEVRAIADDIVVLDTNRPVQVSTLPGLAASRDSDVLRATFQPEQHSKDT